VPEPRVFPAWDNTNTSVPAVRLSLQENSGHRELQVEMTLPADRIRDTGRVGSGPGAYVCQDRLDCLETVRVEAGQVCLVGWREIAAGRIDQAALSQGRASLRVPRQAIL